MLRGKPALVLSIMIALVFLTGSALSSLTIFSPFRPGELLFPLQRLAEEIRLAFIFDKFELANRRLDLAEIRLTDLQVVIGSEDESLVMTYLDKAIDSARLAVQAVPADQTAPLFTRLATLAANALGVLDRLAITPSMDPNAYRAVYNKIQILLAQASGKPTEQVNLLNIAEINPSTLTEASQEAAVSTPTFISPRGIPFPPGATPGEHAIFPLTGEHATLACGDCHLNNTYGGTPHQCEACHANVKPANHYSGTCDTCHTTLAWKPATFNHTGLEDCGSCHLANRPANHFDGQCSLCHTPTAWQPAIFNHAGFNDCLSCHTLNKPANHYTGQCSACHTTSAWKPATFNHAGFDDCLACHATKKPANHWEGQCSLCHNTNAWKPASFNHSVIGNADCATCHVSRVPSNHFNGPCSACHKDTTNWKNATFDHSFTGGADCAACHAPPANHYSGACGACHKDTSNWRNAAFDHSTIGGADCATCHTPPTNHFPGVCSSCHRDTTNWRNATFNHTFPLNHKDANGECAKCHSGNNYSAWTCTACHSQSKMNDKHKEINGYTDNCLACHADGRKPRY